MKRRSVCGLALASALVLTGVVNAPFSALNVETGVVKAAPAETYQVVVVTNEFGSATFDGNTKVEAVTKALTHMEALGLSEDDFTSQEAENTTTFRQKAVEVEEEETSEEAPVENYQVKIVMADGVTYVFDGSDLEEARWNALTHIEAIGFWYEDFEVTDESETLQVWTQKPAEKEEESATGEKEQKPAEKEENEANKPASSASEKKDETAPKTGDIQLLGYLGTTVATLGAFVATKKRK